MRNALTISSFFLFVFLFASCSQRKLQRKHQYMNDAYTELKNGLSSANVLLVNDSIKVMFPDNVIFDFGMAAVLPKFSPVLDRFVTVLNEYPKTGVLIIGHTDSIGSDADNILLSTRRANNTETVLREKGIQEKRLNSWGLGERMPIASNATDEGRTKNRRVEFVVLYNYRNKNPKKH